MLRMTGLVIGLFLALGLFATLRGSADAAQPTCSDVLEVEVHGQHIIGDYVTGEGRANLEWPPSGGVGQAIAGEGPAITGGPGPGFHFPNGFAPGASFCLANSQSPGFHAGH